MNDNVNTPLVIINTRIIIYVTYQLLEGFTNLFCDKGCPKSRFSRYSAFGRNRKPSKNNDSRVAKRIERTFLDRPNSKKVTLLTNS
jgi:hypothetical protein